MKKLLLLSLLVLSTTFMWATLPTITIDGDKSDWAEVPMLSEPGTWPMLKVLPAADAELGTNALVYMMENNADFDPTWAQYPTEFIDKDYDGTTSTLSSYWAFDAMGLEYSATTGVQIGEDWVSFPKAMSANNKVFEIGFPATYITDLGSKFAFAMYYNSGAWFCPDHSSPAVSPSNGFLYKTRAYTTLPATLTPENVYAHQSMGECTSYIDFGLRDNGNDTARWAAWPVELTKSGAYDVIANVTTTNGWKFEFWLVDVATNAIVAQMDAPTSDISSSKTSYNFGTMDLSSVPAGKYMLKVKNRTRFSKVKLESVVLDYLGGAVVNIPAILEPIDAMRSEYALINGDGEFRFTDDSHDGYVTSQWGKWNIHVTKGGSYNFTLNANSDNSHHYYLSVLNPDESLIEKFTLDGSSATPLTATTANLELAPGDYIVKIENFTSNSHGRVINIVANYLGGATIDLPATLMPEDAIRSEYAQLIHGDVDTLTFARPDHEWEAIDAEYTVDGSQYVKWNINIAKDGKYKFSANTYCKQGHNYRIMLLNADETSTIYSKQEAADNTYSWASQGADLLISTDPVDLPVGNYVLKIQAKAYGRVMSVIAEYHGGAVIDIPGQLLGEDAVLESTKMSRLGNGDIKYNDNGTPTNEYAWWNIHAAAAGELIVTLNLDPDNDSGHNYLVELYDGTTLKSSTQQGANDYHKGDIELTDHIVVPTAGDYTIRLTNQTEHSSNILHGITFTPYVAPAAVTIDENATDNSSWIDYKDGAPVNVQFIRTLTAGMYNTFCAPFAISSSLCKTAFGSDVEIYTLKEATVEGDILNVELKSETSIYQGTPVLIKPSSDIVDPSFNGVSIVSATPAATTKTNANFVGTFIKTELEANPDILFLGPNNTLYFPEQTTPIKGMRAWFVVHDVPGGSHMIRHARIVQNEQVVTAIELVNQKPIDTIKVVENGQIIIVRDGIRYNTLGARVK